ncbi:hypothetical protein DPMN_125650 [Dreissena polymorpha]|uniref:Uncharacterized protein n=1 Tax=Dreissena polymorpha TaxID=45954 RepID=A0A9D4GVT9_DREPO|nr:hypothetical protein DPMN_125650 [Dreissena polymorpha]
MEEDHAGHLAHSYEAIRTSEGLKLIRSHSSLTDVHRMHYKTTHLNDLLTPQLVEAHDNITLQHTPNTVNFKHSDPATDHALHEMHQDSISVKPKPEEKVPMSQVDADIREYITCVHSYTNKYDRNRTECVHQLRGLITSLERDDFLTLGREALTRTCEVNDTVCVDERNLLIDLIAREGSADAQLLVLEHVMSRPNVTEEDMRRCLFHAIALQNPVTELVSQVEQLCFEDGHGPGETPALTKTRKRACLSLGAMAKSLHERNTTESDRIVERIENWLDHHNENRIVERIENLLDHHNEMRKTAHHVFKRHPMADDRNFTFEHETEVISKNYTYPIVSRVRRSLLQALEEGIQVTIKPPGIDWQKTVGTSSIGASFGLVIRNILDLKLALLSGHFMVDMYDGAFAEAHVGLIGYKVDIVKAYVYGKTLTQVVNEIVDIVKNLPTRLGEVASRMRDFVKELYSISANTVIEEIKGIVKEVSDFIDEVKKDALKFYNDVADAVTMALPYTAKKIMDAFNTIVEKSYAGNHRDVQGDNRKNTVHDLLNNLQGKWDHVLAPLQPLIDFVKPFVELFKSIMDGIKGIKWGYQKVKEA